MNSLKIHKSGSSPLIWLESGSLFLWWPWAHPRSKNFVDLISHISDLIFLNIDVKNGKKSFEKSFSWKKSRSKLLLFVACL